jgi:hypothetical protein
MAYTTINKPNLQFNTVTYTGNGTTNAVTGVGFQPDFTWLKCRSFANRHILLNVIQGTYSLSSNETGVEINRATDGFTSLDSDGFTLNGSGGGGGDINISSRTYTSWNWKANGAGVSNTQGSITSTVSANTTSGFSIVSYTGNGTSGATVGHGIGSTVGMMLVKGRSFSDNWAVYHKSIGGTGFLELNGTGGTNTVSTRWNDTNAGATVFTLGNNSQVNGNGSTYIAYCFAEVKGFSKFGSYTGNGSADGPFVYTGFRPAFLMIKQTNTGGENWYMWDNKRDTYNVADKRLYPNLNNAEETGTLLFDFLSNGFKIRSTYTGFNQSSGTFIYAAFAENPLVGTNNTPATAR